MTDLYLDLLQALQLLDQAALVGDEALLQPRDEPRHVGSSSRLEYKWVNGRMFSVFPVFFQPPNNTKTKICISFGLREFASSSLTTMVLLLSSVYPNHNIARRSPHNKDIVVWVPAPPHLPRLRCANTPVSQNYPLWWFSCLEFKWNRNNNCYAIILLSQFRVILIHANN